MRCMFVYTKRKRKKVVCSMWECSKCNYAKNPDSAERCKSCDTPRVKFGSSSVPATTYKPPQSSSRSVFGSSDAGPEYIDASSSRSKVMFWGNVTRVIAIIIIICAFIIGLVAANLPDLYTGRRAFNIWVLLGCTLGGVISAAGYFAASAAFGAFADLLYVTTKTHNDLSQLSVSSQQK